MLGRSSSSKRLSASSHSSSSSLTASSSIASLPEPSCSLPCSWRLAALEPVERGRVIDIASELGSAYGAYRQRLLQLWLVGLGAVLGLVALRHRALRPTLIAYAPAVLAAAGTAATLTLLGLELNMLSLVALLMVVSMGVDYGVFLAEHRDDPAQRDATMLAVAVAGCTTILGFGLLSLSSQPPLLHIGLTSAIGVLLCLLLAPTVCALATRGE